MRTKKFFEIPLLALAGLLWSGAPSSAHDIFGLFHLEKVDETTRLRIEEPKGLLSDLSMLRRRGVPNTESLEAVIVRGKLWRADRPIIVCFFEGGPSLRSMIMGYANEWAKGGMVTFDFGSTSELRTCDPLYKSGIRVSFRGRGHYSYVGTDSLLVSQEIESLNLGEFDVLPPADGEFRRIVLHEFGHAIGFEHEHQSPKARCEEDFDWPLVYRSLPWTRAKVDRNLRRLPNSSAYLVSEYDDRSIMHYSLPARFFRDGRRADCYIEPNFEISDQDSISLAQAYGRQTARSLSEELVAPAAGKDVDKLSESRARSLKIFMERLDDLRDNRRLSEE